MFNHILLAIDLSNQPRLLYRYGLDLSNQLGSNLELVYIFHLKQLKGRLRSGKTPEELKIYFQQKLQQLKPLEVNKENLSPLPERAVVQKKVLEGFPEEELLKCSRSPDTDLIIMGIKSFSYPFNDEFGLVVSEVSQEALCPVLLLPPNISFSGFQKILFINDGQVIYQDKLEYIAGLTYLFNSEIHILHVHHFTQRLSSELEERIKEELQKLAPGVPIHFALVDSEDMLQSINDYLSNFEISLVNFISYNRYFWVDFLKHKMKNTYQLCRDLPIMINHFEG